MRNPKPGCVKAVLRGEGGGSGPPSWELTDKGYDLIKEHASLGCPITEIADAMRVDRQWLSKKIEESPVCDPLAHEAFMEGLAEHKKDLRLAQKELGKVNAQMAIWNGKQHLGQRDQQIIDVTKRIQVVGTLPDYAQSPADWQKIFAPKAIAKALASPVEEAQVVDDKE